MEKREVDIFYPSNLDAWREWLKEHHLSQAAVWLVFYKKSSKIQSITWSEAVDVALCFGWIDSKKIKIDEERSHQFFSKRKPNSTWSKINKQKVKHLIDNGWMTEAGFKAIEIAKQNGSWTILNEVDDLLIPSDLEAMFEDNPSARDFFLSLSNSAKKAILQWIVLAKRPETRKGRITKTVALAAENQKPKIF